MDSFPTDLISLLQYLLPGFLAAWVFYGLTSYPKPSQFERVIQALIFTLIIQAIVYCVKIISLQVGKLWTVANWSNQSELVISVVGAFIVGLVFAYGANTDKFHELMRKIGVTEETSYPSEWFGVLRKNVTYVVLHLNDERRIYGWPYEWPSEPGKGHFAIKRASWLEDGEEKPITGVDCVLIRAEDVKWIEFMSMSSEETNE